MRILVIAGIAKLLGAAIALVTGWRGGFIIPLFFTGFVLGWAVAGWLPIEHEWVFIAGTMVAANVAVTKTPFGSALVVTEMAGFTLLPTTLVSSLTCLVLTSPVGLIDNQRRRFDAYEPTHDGRAVMSERLSDRPLSDADYRSLAEFRHALRRFLAFSEHAARDHGLTPSQHQLLLAIRGHAGPSRSVCPIWPRCCSSSCTRSASWPTGRSRTASSSVGPIRPMPAVRYCP